MKRSWLAQLQNLFSFFQWQSPTSFSTSSISFKRVLPSFFREKGTNVEELAFSFSLSLSQLKMCDTNFLCQRDSKRVEWNDKSFSFFSVSSILGSFKFVTDWNLYVLVSCFRKNLILKLTQPWHQLIILEKNDPSQV